MINEYYKNFRIRDYMDNEGLNEQLIDKLIDCSLGTNPFITDEFVKECILNSTCKVNEYQTKEHELLMEKLLEIWNSKLGTNYTKNNISFGAGAMGILRNLATFLIDENTKVLGIAPQFPRTISEVELRRGIYGYYNLNKSNNFKFDVDEFVAHINEEFGVIEIENPNNPTGQIIPLNDIEKIVKKAQELDIVVVIDEAYGEYIEDFNSAITLVEKYNNIVVIRSASKYYGLPNQRVGYLFAGEEIIKVYNEITLPFAFTDLSASIFKNVLDKKEEIEYTKELVIEAKTKIMEELKDKNILYSSNSTPIFTIYSSYYDNLCKELIKRGIIAEPCSEFLNLGEKYARIRINKDYEKIIKILKDVI